MESEVTYKLKPEFKERLLMCLGNISYNEIGEIMSFCDLEIVTHTQLSKFVNVVGRLPFILIANFLNHIDEFVEVQGDLTTA